MKITAFDSFADRMLVIKDGRPVSLVAEVDLHTLRYVRYAPPNAVGYRAVMEGQADLLLLPVTSDPTRLREILASLTIFDDVPLTKAGPEGSYD